jgi:hypothetical protein
MLYRLCHWSPISKLSQEVCKACVSTKERASPLLPVCALTVITRFIRPLRSSSHSSHPKSIFQPGYYKMQDLSLFGGRPVSLNAHCCVLCTPPFSTWTSHSRPLPFLIMGAAQLICTDPQRQPTPSWEVARVQRDLPVSPMSRRSGTLQRSLRTKL